MIRSGLSLLPLRELVYQPSAPMLYLHLTQSFLTGPPAPTLASYSFFSFSTEFYSYDVTSLLSTDPLPPPHSPSPMAHKVLSDFVFPPFIHPGLLVTPFILPAHSASEPLHRLFPLPGKFFPTCTYESCCASFMSLMS